MVLVEDIQYIHVDVSHAYDEQVLGNTLHESALILSCIHLYLFSKNWINMIILLHIAF